MQWAGLAVAVLLLGTAGRAAADDFSWHGTLGQGGVVKILGDRGNIVAEPSTGGQVEVTGKKKGSDADLKGVDVRAVEENGKVTICAVYPGENRCPGASNSPKDHPKNDARIDFTVRVPAGVHLVADTEIGKIEAKSLAGPVDARTVIGDIDIATSSYAQAASTNGNIAASLGSTAWTDAVRFETVNGNILVKLPRKGDTDLRAKSTTGSFKTDLFPTPQNRYGIPGADVSGTLGSGGRMLKIGTVNGSIRLEPIS
jgi:DUF4097 and DUF4098 domain-containing protein YvlB